MSKCRTKSVIKPSLSTLLKRVKRLSRDLGSLAKKYVPKKDKGIRPIEYPLHLGWRRERDRNNTDLESQIKDTLKWVGMFDEYLRDSETYFVHWEDRPDTFKRFPLAKCVRGYWSSQNTSRESILECLEQHEVLLLIERSKTESSELRGALRSAISKSGFSDQGAAKKMGLNRKTLEDFLNGKTSKPRAPTRRKMQSFVDKHSGPTTVGSSVT